MIGTIEIADNGARTYILRLTGEECLLLKETLDERVRGKTGLREHITSARFKLESILEEI